MHAKLVVRLVLRGGLFTPFVMLNHKRLTNLAMTIRDRESTDAVAILRQVVLSVLPQGIRPIFPLRLKHSCIYFDRLPVLATGCACRHEQ